MIKMQGVSSLESIRVVDALVMPAAPSGNINAAVIAVAEKAADLILGNTPLEPSKAGFFRRQPAGAEPQTSATP